MIPTLILELALKSIRYSPAVRPDISRLLSLTLLRLYIDLLQFGRSYSENLCEFLVHDIYRTNQPI